MVREVLENVLPYMGVEPSGQITTANKTDVKLADYRGLSLMETSIDLTVKD